LTIGLILCIFHRRKGDKIFCVTAHNRVCEISIDFREGKFERKRRSRCPEVSTAYSSSILGDSWESILLFAGTAFGELIIWKPKCDTEIGEILLRVPQSHNGVIFDIQMCLEAKLLTTCSDDRSVQLWKFEVNSDGKPILEKIKRCFAHISRVFRSKIIKHEENFYILSIGEDSHVCLWDNEGTLMFKKFLDDCGTIWGLDYCAKTMTSLVVTNNGRLVKVPLKLALTKNASKTEIIGENVAKLTYMSPAGLLICLKIDNEVAVYDVNDVNSPKMNFKLEASSKFCLMETFKHFLYLVTTDSKVIVYEYSTEKQDFSVKNEKIINWDDENGQTRSMIRSFFPLDDFQIVICSNNGVVRILEAQNFNKIHEFHIPKCSEPWITSAINTKDSKFLIADRCGHLHLFKNGNPDPIFTRKRLHGTMGITQIVKIDDFTFKTTGHDSTVKTISLVNDELKQIFTEKLAINFIERRFGEFTFGFSSSYFICHHQQDGILIEENCGGGNRQYDLFLDELERCGKFSLAVIQQRKVKQVTFRVDLSHQSPLTFPDLRWHHLSCNYLSLVNTKNGVLLISGGEETLMKFYLMRNDGNLEHLKTSTQHNSAIKSIISTKTSKNDDLIVISVGSRSKICFTKIRSALKELSIEEDTQFMLYEDKLTPEKDQTISFDPESSFTSTTLVNETLICACSDGHLRLFALQLDANPIKISLDREIFYGKSILHVQKVIWHGFTMILSMATDGVINFWQFPTMSKVHELKHHGNGIHAYDICEQGNEILIATGGDDQSIVISRVLMRKNEGNLKLETDKTFKIPDLHTAQVTGVRFLSDQVLMTLGVDQMIYKLTFDDDLSEKKIEKSYWTSVEDGKGLLYFKDKVIVYGNGIEIF
ncbi:tRNA (34-2'-O)-methyltransferase regulator WDR6, partial [Culicoides brevitarsis]|uniref:tRNA (34-2'-O)-methyltransferase regulator WDR6 n=1 Tax=Culicoides brevitarsis TaxID=469753 RepID=UPI00307C90EE